MKWQDLRISQVEYQIRRTERGIKVLHAQGGSSEDILIYGEMREKFKDELEALTQKRHFSSGQWKVLVEGRREPKTPEWPV